MNGCRGVAEEITQRVANRESRECLTIGIARKSLSGQCKSGSPDQTLDFATRARRGTAG